MNGRKYIRLIKFQMVVPVSLSFVRAPAHPGYPGLKDRKMVVHSVHV